MLLLFYLPSSGNDSVFKLNYVARAMNFLHGVQKEVIEELSSILKICSKHCKAYGLWFDLKDEILYLVCERLDGTVLDLLPQFENSSGKNILSSFWVMGTEICKSGIGLHLENLSLGCSSLSCFELDDFGHVNISPSKILLTGRTVHEAFLLAGFGGRVIGEKEMGSLISELFKNEVFISPEILFGILKKEGLDVDCGSSVCFVVCRSDVWSLACVLVRLLMGKQFVDELVDYVVGFISNVGEENCPGLYMRLMEKVSSLLGEEFEYCSRFCVDV